MSGSHQEEFQSVVGFPGYRVSNCGRVQSCWKRGCRSAMTGVWKDLKPRVHTHGCRYVTLSRDGGEFRRYAHTLVLEAFAGPCPDGMECRHLNGDPSDNRWPDNIIWGTYAENTADLFRHGRGMIGESHYAAKLTAEQVRQIREASARGEFNSDVASRLGVSQGAVADIVRGDNWRCLEDSQGADPVVRSARRVRRKCSKLTSAIVQEIRRRLAAGELAINLAREYGVKPHTVSNIKTGRTWKHVSL